MRGTWLVAAAALVAGCKNKDDGVAMKPVAVPGAAAPGTPAEGTPVRKGPLWRQPFAMLTVIIPADTATTKLVTLAKSTGEVDVEMMAPDKAGFRIEDLDSYGSRYPASDRPALAKATVAIVIRARGRDARRRVGASAVTTARAAGGWIVDPHQHQLYTADSIIEHLPGAAPLDVRKLVMIHQVAGDGELAFFDTAGMAELGLPELLVADVPRGEINSATNLLNATAQTLLDRGEATRDGELDVDATKLPGDWGLEAIEKLGGTGRVTWQLTWDRGDADPAEQLEPEQLAIKLTIAGTRPGSAEGLVAAIGTYFGAEPDEARSLDDYRDELDAAAVKARASLAKLRAHFAKGVPFAEQLAIKAPFRQGDKTEWMWVDVVGWKGEALDGTLDNEPGMVTNVKIGQRVKVELREVADYIHQRADGTKVGGFSLEVLRNHGEDVPPL